MFYGCSAKKEVPQTLIHADDLFKDINASQKTYKSDKDVLMFILDTSESMNDLDRSGIVKIDAVKDMLIDMSSQVNNNKTNVGLICYTPDCNESQLLAEPSNNDLDHVIYVSNQIVPSGLDPLSSSIKKAKNTLSNIYKKINIIIISDGTHANVDDSIVEVRELKESIGDNVDIHVVGYSVKDFSKSQLEIIAMVAKGTYHDIDDGTQLSTTIANITDNLNIKSKNWQGDVFKFSINFKSGTGILEKKYDGEIKKLASYLKRTNHSAEIQGHSDSTGDEGFNRWISKKRANAVMKRLIDFGVNKEKIYSTGYGELAPIADNKTKKGRFTNRRVEAHLIKNGKMNLKHINKANMANEINARITNKNSFVGYYKLKRTNKPYEKYNMWLELYANNKGLYTEYRNGIKLTSLNDRELYWSFDKKSSTFTLDYSNKGEKSNFVNFRGKISGTINEFELKGKWSNRVKDYFTITRVNKCELECIKRDKKFINGSCVEPK